jgi:hypothetical protein
MKERILFLILKTEWFEMIEADIKKEEYRDMTPHYYSRLVKDVYKGHHFFKEFDFVVFQLGYKKNARRVKLEFKGIEIGEGKSKWGAVPGREYFVIKLGNIIT